MSIFDERYASSLELPNPADIGGEILFCYEPGVDQVCAWQATGGETAPAWMALADSYVGPWQGIPAASHLLPGATAWITNIGAVQELGANVWTFKGGRLRTDGTRWRPPTPIALLEAMSIAGTPIASSGNGALASGATSAMALAAGDLALPPLPAGSVLLTEIDASRVSGTTSSIGLLAALAIHGKPIHGAVFNAGASAVESGSRGLAVVTDANDISAQTYSLAGAQAQQPWTSIAVAGLAAGGVVANAVRVNNSGGSLTDALVLNFVRLTLQS